MFTDAVSFLNESVLYFNKRFVKDEFKIMFSELDVQIGKKEILFASKQLKTGHSAGPDKMLNEIFIHGKNELIDFICPFFNKVFNTGFFSGDWSEGYIIPLYKKGNTNDVNYYLLSTPGKLFTRILSNRLYNWAENYSIYIEVKAGFRQNMGTIDNIFVLHGIILHMINKNRKLLCSK